MRSDFLTDVVSAAGVFRAVREARRDGFPVKVQAVTTLPCYRLPPAFPNTVEGIQLYNQCDRSTYSIAEAVFYDLPYGTRHALECSPKDGELLERAQFWKEALRPAMDPKQLPTAMIAILRWYWHIKGMCEA